MTGLNRALVTGQTSKHRTFCFMPCNLIFDQKIIVFPEDSWSFFAVMSSRLHENWATFMGSTMKDDPVYTPSDCFENFPFPELYRSNTRLDAIGEAYANFRSALMIHNDEGLTKTYNRFHDPSGVCANCTLRSIVTYLTPMDGRIFNRSASFSLSSTMEMRKTRVDVRRKRSSATVGGRRFTIRFSPFFST